MNSKFPHIQTNSSLVILSAANTLFVHFLERFVEQYILFRYDINCMHLQTLQESLMHFAVNVNFDVNVNINFNANIYAMLMSVSIGQRC